MNKKLLITSIIAVIAIVAIAVVAVLLPGGNVPLESEPLGNKDVLLSKNGPESTVDYDVSSDIGYELAVREGITLANIGDKVLVTDTDGNKVDVQFADKGGGVFTVNAPSGGYIPGAVYTITLSNGVCFAEESKSGVNTWDFIVAKPATEEVVYQDNVVALAPNTFTVVSDSQITSIADFAVGTVVIIPVGGGYEAYKVESSEANGGGYTLNVVVPEEEEVFKSIDISGKYTIKDGTLVFNEEVLLEQLMNSELVLGLNLPKPKISFPKASINKDEGLVYLDILITFSNFIPDVESSLSILISNVINIEPFVNYQTIPFSFNIGADMAIETTTTFSISVGKSYQGQFDVEELISELATLTNQTISENFLRVFSWTYPIGTTGLMLSYDLDLVLRVSFAGTLSATTVNFSTYRLGVYYVNSDLKAICDKKSSSFELDRIELVGNLEAKAGILNTLSLSFLQIAKVSIKLEAGLYADIYGAVQFNLENIKETQGGYYLDAGLYYDLSIAAGIEILGFGTSKEIPLVGDKFSLFEAGSRTMVVDYAVDAEDGAVNEIAVSARASLIPNLTIKQYDLVNRTFSFVKVGYEKSNFVLEGVQNFTVNNGVLVLNQGAEDTFTETLLVQYKAKKTVSHTITVTKDREMPYITDDAIKTFDKAVPVSLTFTIDLLESTFVRIEAEGLENYNYQNGVLTLNWEYLIRRPNGVLEVKFVTSKNTVTVWVEIKGAVSLTTVGAGTEADPYKIYTVDQIVELANTAAANNYYQGKYFQLSDNIDMREEAFTPIADFKGVFDGNGYIIRNLVINALGVNDTAGLFAVNSGTVKNLTLNSQIKINGQRTVTAGAIAGYNYGTISGCTAQGAINVECKTNNLNRTFFNVGGIVGINKGTIINTTANNDLYVTSSSYNVLTKAYIAGVAGLNEGTVTSCVGYENKIHDDIAWYNGKKINAIYNS